MEAPSQQLYRLLCDSRERTSCQQFIISDASLCAILTYSRIRLLLFDELHVAPHLVEQTTYTVRDGSIKILAILICIGRVGALLTHFIHRGITDGRLPLPEADLTPEFSETFLYEQQHFLAPVFTRGIFRDWRPEVVLPFATDEPLGDDAAGSYATVYKIGIIPSFQKLVNVTDNLSCKAFFARKELRTRRSKASSAAFHREKEVLELLNLVCHANIVPLLASYIHSDTYNMIFPLAGGDLEDMFTGRVNISSFTDDAIWLQVLGITSALATLHKFQYSTDMAFELSKIGYHHDLKPQNILIKEGTFLLADFGLARLKDIDRGSSTDHKYGTVTYGAPESQRHIGNHPIRVNRALDIWSWGCILSEIVTFTLLGSPGVIRFRQFRRTTNGMRDDCYFHDMKDVKQEVRDWLLYLNRISDAHQYKVLIGKTLQIVECMLAADPSCRPSAASIHESFCIFLSEAGINTEDLKSGEGKYDDRDSRISLAPTGNIATHLVQLAGNDPQVFVETAGFVEDKKLHLEDTLDSLRTILPEDHPVIRAVATYNRDGER